MGVTVLLGVVGVVAGDGDEEEADDWY